MIHTNPSSKNNRATRHDIDPYWFLLPAAMYLFERAFRYHRSTQRVRVLAVCFMKPSVFSVELALEGPFARPYKEGQVRGKFFLIGCPDNP